MPKIPRSRNNVVKYQPSAAPEIPMGLADYSSMINALDKGAQYAAQRHNQKVDEEAKLSINTFSNDMEEATQDFSLRPYETSSLQKGGKPLSLKEKSKQRDTDFKKIVDDLTPSEEIQKYWASRHRIALQAAVDNALTKNAMKTRLLESQTLVSAHKANYKKWEEKTLTNIRDINVPIDSIFREIEGSWDLRLKDASAGGLMENPEQVEVAKLAFKARLLPALLDRYEQVWNGRMDDSSIRTTSDLESPITDLKSDEERKAAGIYGSYMEFYRDIKKNGRIAGYDVNSLSPDKNNLEIAKESHDRIFDRLDRNRTARRTAATANFNTAFNEYMTLASREQRGFNDVEMNHIKALANAAGTRLSSHFFNFQTKAKTKPSMFQEENNHLIEYQFERINTDALARDVVPDFTAFTLRVLKEYDAGMLHVSDMQSAFKALGTARTAKGKRVNSDVKEVMDLFSKEYLVKSEFRKGRKRLGKGPDGQLGFYEGFNAEIAGDIRPFIRDAVRRAHASNKTVDPYAIYKSTVAHIQQVTKNMNPLKINILQEELEPILRKKQDGGVLDDKEQLIYGLSLAKMDRNARFKRGAKKFIASNNRLRGASALEYKKFREAHAEELSFLEPGGYDIEALHNKYRRVDSTKPKEGAGTTAEPKEATGEQNVMPNAKQAQDMINAMPDGIKKTKMQEALTGLHGDKPEENPEEINMEKPLSRPSPHDEKDVKTLSKSGKFETPTERGESMKEAKVNKSVIASVISSVKDAFAGGDKGGKAIADYKAGLEKEWGSPIPKVLSGWIGQLYDAGETVLAEELYGVLALLSADVEVAPPEVPVAEYSDFKEQYGYTPDELFTLQSLTDKNAETGKPFYDFPFEFLTDKLREYEDTPNKDANDKKAIKLLRRKIKAEMGE